MAKTGLKYIVAALLDESGATPTYTDGIVVGKAISANISVENNTAVLYADDAIAESVTQFKSGKLALNTDDLTYAVQGQLLGHECTATTLTAKAGDVAPFVGVGYCGAVRRNNAVSYRAIWLFKNQFAEPADESSTAGESIEFKTPSIEASTYTLADGTWKTEAMFATEQLAIDWLNEKAGIVEA